MGAGALSTGAQTAILAVMGQREAGRVSPSVDGGARMGVGEGSGRGNTEQMSVGGNVECSGHVWGRASGLWDLRRVRSVPGSCPLKDLSVPSSGVGAGQGWVTALGSGK